MSDLDAIRKRVHCREQSDGDVFALLDAVDELGAALAKMVNQHCHRTGDSLDYWNSCMSADETAFEALCAYGFADGNCHELTLREDPTWH